MNNEAFHSKVLRTIDECSYKFYVVSQNKNISCVCTNHTTKQPDMECKICLGTGYKIRIKMGKGASNEEVKGRLSIGPDSTQVTRKYFVKYENRLNELNLIIDEDSIYYVERIADMRALKGVYTHQEIVAIKLKNDHDIRLSNFRAILEKHSKKK